MRNPNSSNGNHLRSYFPFPLEMENCACAMCLSADAKTLLTFDSFGFPTHTVECQECGLIYVNPRPTRQYMDNFYRTWFRLFYEGRRRVSEAYIRDKQWREWDASRVKRYSGYLAGHNRVLDIGCGAGYFAAQVKTYNPTSTVIGIEPDPMMVSHCREKLNLDIHLGFWETFHSSEPFHVITAFHLVEHLFDLDNFFWFLRNHLRDDGIVIIETPNVAGPWEGIGLFHIAHLYAFSPRTITRLFMNQGFDVLEAAPLENDLDDSNLYLIARKMKTCGQKPLFSVDSEESARIATKCMDIRSARASRILRNWAKMAYFGLRS